MAVGGTSESRAFGGALLAIIVLFVISTLATSLNDANTTSLKEVIADGFITGFAVFVLAIVLIVIGYGVGPLKRLMNAFN